MSHYVVNIIFSKTLPNYGTHSIHANLFQVTHDISQTGYELEILVLFKDWSI